MPTAQARSRTIWIFAGAIALAFLVWLFRRHITFDWAILGSQLRSVSISRIALGVAILYAGYWLRALRWAVLVSPVRPARAADLFPAQLIGFTAVVLIGRLADLSRPYLIARRLKLPIASQLAIYSIERAFDLGAAAILFSLTLAFAPRNLPHHELYLRAGALSLAATAALAVFVLALRFAGEAVSRTLGRLIAPLSSTLAPRVAARVLDFRLGLNTIANAREFFSAAAISLLLWLGIALGYMLSARAFTLEPTLAHFGFTATMLILATSMGGSLLQLPVLGWFTQIAINAAALHGFFGVPLEAATASATVMLFVMSLDIIPLGLIAARLQGVSVGEATREPAIPTPLT